LRTRTIWNVEAIVAAAPGRLPGKLTFPQRHLTATFVATLLQLTRFVTHLFVVFSIGGRVDVLRYQRWSRTGFARRVPA